MFLANVIPIIIFHKVYALVLVDRWNDPTPVNSEKCAVKVIQSKTFKLKIKFEPERFDILLFFSGQNVGLAACNK